MKNLGEEIVFDTPEGIAAKAKLVVAMERKRGLDATVDAVIRSHAALYECYQAEVDAAWREVKEVAGIELMTDLLVHNEAGEWTVYRRFPRA